MAKRLRQSPALVVTALALVAAFGATAIAGTPLTAAKKAKHKDAKQDKKQFKKLLKAAAPELSVAHAVKADSATTATTADTAKSAQPAAFALIDGGGTVSQGKGVTNANVSHPSDGTYCISGLAFVVKGAVVTTEFGGSPSVAMFTPTSTTACPSGG